jgi:hypothetical protein
LNVTFSVIISICVLIACALGFIVSFRLWSLLGKSGITSWFMLAFTYAIGLRTLSLLGDLGYGGGMMDYTRPLSFPMYVMFVLGVAGLLRQVRKAMRTGHITPTVPVQAVILKVEAEVIVPEATIKIPARVMILHAESNGKPPE